MSPLQLSMQNPTRTVLSPIGHHTEGVEYVARSTDPDDLGIAKEALSEGDLTLVVAKDGKILFKSKSHGVSDMLAMIDELGTQAEDASLADSVVGRAAALLCVYSRTAAVYGVRMSEGAASILKAKGIRHEFGTLVPKILNRARTDICPFDRAVLGLEDPSIALERLKALRMT